MLSLFDPNWRSYYLKVGVAFVGWTVLWAWLVYIRPERRRWGTLLIVLAGYAVMSALAFHYVHYILNYHD